MFVIIRDLESVSARLPRIHVHLINTITLVEHVTSRLPELSVTADLDFTLRTNQPTLSRYQRLDYATSDVLTSDFIPKFNKVNIRVFCKKKTYRNQLQLYRRLDEVLDLHNRPSDLDL